MKSIPAATHNSTFCVLVRSGMDFRIVYPQSWVTDADGKIVPGKNTRRLLNVKEIAHSKGCSLNDAQKARAAMPFEFLVPPTDERFHFIQIRERDKSKTAA